MKPVNQSILVRLLILIGLVTQSPLLFAGDSKAGPVIPEAVARFSPTQGCVEPTEEMREHHMEYILHQRDETMHRGIRTKKHSLAECINCHVPEAKNGRKIRASEPEHFCDACHSYASVNIDCFQCHNDQPTGKPISAESINSAAEPRSLLGLFSAGESQ